MFFDDLAKYMYIMFTICIIFHQYKYYGHTLIIKFGLELQLEIQVAQFYGKKIMKFKVFSVHVKYGMICLTINPLISHISSQFLLIIHYFLWCIDDKHTKYKLELT